MKKKLLIIGMLSLMVACSPQKTKTNNKELARDQAKLDKLKADAAKTRTEIKTLEAKIAAEGGAQLRDNAKDVAVSILKPQTFKHYVEVQAMVDGQENINVSAQMAGVATKVVVHEGDKVKEGDVLAQLDDKVILENIQEVKTNLDFAKTMYEKQKNLWDQKIGTEVQYLSAKNNYESLKKRLAALQQQLDMTKITSPINGTVDQVNVKIGEAVMPGMPVARVVNLSHLKIDGQVAEAYISKVHIGDKVDVNFPDLNKTITSRIAYVSKVIDNVNRTFNVEVKLDPNNPDYHPNMIAVLKIVDYQLDSAMVIPINAVQSTESGSFVFLAEKDGAKWKAKKVKVQVGKIYNGSAEIRSGLHTGDQLITVGFDDLNDGDAVKL